jgi:L-2-hydroxyglutarate oxidase
MLDFIIVGGGIIGLSTAMQLARRAPGAAILLVEKEAELAAHQTGRNSGVVHAGVYYEPGSLKARYCREGNAETAQFAAEHGIAFDRCGKLIVATREDELSRFATLEERARRNGLNVERIDAAELRRREPHIAGLAALHVPETGTTDFPALTRAMAADFTAAGGTIACNTQVLSLEEDPDGINVATNSGVLRTRHLIGCAGLNADRLAAMAGIELDFAIVPFRGEYFRLPAARDQIVSHLIYPVPDPAFPFLGVHLTRMIGGYVTVGPNAVLSLKREGYSTFAFDARDAADIVRFPGFRRFLAKNFRYGVGELRNSLSRQRYLDLCQRYCPELTLDDLQPYRSGVRAQAMFADGTLAHDFLLRRTARSIHVCNAPSPAATAALPIGRHIVDEAAATGFVA